MKHTYEVAISYKDYSGQDTTITKKFKCKTFAKLYYKRHCLRNDMVVKYMVDGETKRMMTN